MLKNIQLVLTFLCVVGFSAVIAQPQYTYTPSSTANQTGPFRSSSLNLKQNLYYPSDFSGTPASGLITTLYVKSSILAVPTSTFSTLTVKMGATSLSSFTSGPYVTGLTTVLNVTNATVSSISGDWMLINLTTPYNYDNTQNLIIEFSQTGHSPGFYTQTSGGSIAPNRSLSGSPSGTTGNSQARLMTLGFDMSSTSPCNPPTGLQIGYIGVDSADVSWDSVATASGFEYQVSTNSSPPASGTFTTDTFYNANSLNANTWYYSHVRTACGSSFSPWAIDSFITMAPPCTPVMPMVNNITDSSAAISWPTHVGANYEYAINNSINPPNNGTLTSMNSIAANGLADTTLYYVHVRSICSMDTSDWSSQSFTTFKNPNVGLDLIKMGNFKITVYPNPVQASLSISTNVTPSNEALLTLSDVSGKTLKTLRMNNRKKVTIDTDTLKPGVYFVRYQDDLYQKVLRVVKK